MKVAVLVTLEVTVDVPVLVAEVVGVVTLQFWKLPAWYASTISFRVRTVDSQSDESIRY